MQSLGKPCIFIAPLLLVIAGFAVVESDDDSTTLSALLAFKASISHDPSSSLASWNVSSSPNYCTWHGVVCANGTAHVIHLVLGSKELTGTLTPLLGDLSYLSNLTISNNSFHGPIPPDLGKLSELLALDLSTNNLSGSLPPSITNCTKLALLDLGRNHLSGPIPSDWSRLAGSLQRLRLAYNHLVGGIPDSLCNCTELRWLNLQTNSLTGKIPDSIGRLIVLQELIILENTLMGAIPASITNCTQLQDFRVGSNNFSGYIPREIGRLQKVQRLEFGENAELTGGIPDTIEGCAQLQYLYIQNTRVGGSLPPSLFNLTNLRLLELSSSEFTGSLSEQVQNLTLLISLLLGGNDLQGPIPAALGNLQNIQGLELQNNKFEGPIPLQLSDCTSLFEMDLSYNALTGSIPTELGKLKSLQNLYLQNNGLSGHIPDMFGSLIGLQSLNLAHNMLTGSIPDSLAKLSTLQILVDLSFNNLSGTIPPLIGEMLLLASLRLSSNQFTGQIPESFASCEGMQILDLSDNQLQGAIPSSLGRMSSLQYLSLSQNRLSGSLPPTLGDLKDLVFLNVSYNSLQGMIPSVGIYKKSSSASFIGNPGLCGYPLNAGCTALGSHHSNRLPIVLGLCIAGAGVLFIAIVCACFCWFHSAPMGAPTSNASCTFDELDIDATEDAFDVENSQFKVWTARELRAVTNGFDDARVIGAGEVSVCFKGVLKREKGKKRLIAVKRLRAGSGYGAEARRSLANEVRALCKVRHRNLVRVEGYCVDEGEVALVMEYMKGGNLGELLQTMSWEQRVSVAADVAQGLMYLHDECVQQPIIHCDLKPSNILFTSDMMTAKIDDFGTASLLEGSRATLMGSSTSEFKGTFGYAAPEYAGGIQISPKVDVYSYGVLLLELVSGVKPTSSQMQEHGVSLHAWVRTLLENGEIKEAIDKVLLKAIEFDPTILEQVKHLLHLGLKCSSELSKDRPTTRSICESIVAIQKRSLHKFNLGN